MLDPHLAALIRLIARAAVADLTAEEVRPDAEPPPDEPTESDPSAPSPPRHSPA